MGKKLSLFMHYILWKQVITVSAIRLIFFFTVFIVYASIMNLFKIFKVHFILSWKQTKVWKNNRNLWFIKHFSKKLLIFERDFLCTEINIVRIYYWMKYSLPRTTWHSMFYQMMMCLVQYYGVLWSKLLETLPADFEDILCNIYFSSST